jgi:hypothetical protein
MVLGSNLKTFWGSMVVYIVHGGFDFWGSME